jgi:hypothetical protein
MRIFSSPGAYATRAAGAPTLQEVVLRINGRDTRWFVGCIRHPRLPEAAEQRAQMPRMNDLQLAATA